MLNHFSIVFNNDTSFINRGRGISEKEFVYKYQIVPMVTEQIPNNESRIPNSEFHTEFAFHHWLLGCIEISQNCLTGSRPLDHFVLETGGSNEKGFN